jgi:hypothetical protein
MGRRVRGQSSRRLDEPDGGDGRPDGEKSGILEVQTGRRPWEAAAQARGVAVTEGAAGLEEVSPSPPSPTTGSFPTVR